MLVARIANTRFYQPQIDTQGKKHFDSVSQSDAFTVSFWGTEKKAKPEAIQPISINEQRFHSDNAYRRQLLKGAELSDKDTSVISSILGPEEIKSMLGQFNDNEEFYSAGENNANVKSGTIRANLHIHTQASDGFFTVQKLLDDAAAQSEHPKYKKAPFVIAITDHDTVRGTREAIKIIAQNPEKYKNIRVILGIEFTTYHKILYDALMKPTNIDVLAYGINPYEQRLVDFIHTTKKHKRKIASRMIEKANELYTGVFGTDEELFNLKQAGTLYSPVNKGILEAHRFLKSYVEIKFLLKQVILRNPEMRAKLKKLYPDLDDNKLVDKLIDEISEFYKPIDNNTKKYGGPKTICTFLSEKLSMDKSKIEQILARAHETRKPEEIRQFETFVSGMGGMFRKYKMLSILNSKEMPDMSDVHEALKNQKKAMLGIAHPLKYLKKIDEIHHEDFLRDLYKQFYTSTENHGAFSEFYYQSYVDGPKEISKMPAIRKMLDDLSKRYHLFKTGGFDCHDAYLFARRCLKK